MTNTAQKGKDFRQELEADYGDLEALGGTDIKINPDYYIHTALLRAQKCLLKEDIKAGFLAYKVFIEHIETLCIAANMLEEDYEKQIEDYKKSVKDTKEPLAREVKISNEKLRLMMTAVFDRKEIKAPLKTS